MAFCFLLNRLLEGEGWARARLTPFAGQTVELRAPPLPALRFAILEGGTVDAGTAPPGLVMTLKPELIPAAARGEDSAMRAIEIEGDGRLAAELLMLARHLRWDAGEELSKFLGDAAAHRLVEAARAFGAWHLDAAQRLAGAFADYATDEKSLLTRRASLEQHAESVARLRDRIARLEKRVERLG